MFHITLDHKFPIKWLVKEGDKLRNIGLVASKHQLIDAMDKLAKVEAKKSPRIKVNPQIDDFGYGFKINHENCTKD